MNTTKAGTRFDLHGVRYTVGPLAPCGRPWAINEASALAMHIIAPAQGPDSVALRDATAVDGDAPVGFLAPTATPRGRDEDVVRGGDLLRGGTRGAAAACYHRALGRNAANTEALIGLARLLLVDGRSEQALELVTRALATEPHLAEYYEVFFRCSHDAPRRFLNQFERAVAFLGPRAAHDADAARAYLALGQPERAQALLATDPLAPPRLTAEVEKALRASRRAHELTAQARHLISDDSRREEACQLLTRAQAASPHDIFSALNLGLTLHQMGRNAEAVTVLQPLADRLVLRDLPVLHANLGFAAAASGNLPLALHSLGMAYGALETITGGQPQQHLELLPCVAKWADAEGRIETSPREPLEVLARLKQACDSTGLELPDSVTSLATLYQIALRAPLTWGSTDAPDPSVELPAVDDWPPQTLVLDHFRVERRLADGQRGTRYTVLHEPSKTRLTLERTRATTAEERRDLWNGLRVWCNLPVHENLLACRSFASNGDEVLVFFEDIEPLTFAAYIKQFRVPEQQARGAHHIAAFAIQLAWALDVAHRSAVTHGPIPLGEIHFTLDRTLKIGGFWNGDQLGEEEAVRKHISAVLAPTDNPLMRALHEDTLRSHVPIPLAGEDPSPWAPPESVEGRGETPQSDAWHWAVAVLEAASICYGLPTSEKETAATRLDALIDSPHVGNLPHQLPAELITILTRSLDGDPARRPRRLAEIAEALQEVYGPHFRQEAPTLSGAQQGARALESLTQTETPDPQDAAADLPWKDPRLALSIAYQAAGLDPLAPQPYLPQGDASEQGRTLAHLAALEVASGLLRDRLTTTPGLVPELARQRFDASMMLANLGDFRGALRQSDEAVKLLRQALDKESVTALRYFLTTVTGEQGSYHAALGQSKEAVEAVREADRICATTLSAAETHAIEANVRMRLATVARRFPETLDIALHCLERALKIWRDQENLEYLGYTQATIAQVHAARSDDAHTRAAWERALPLLKPFSDKRSGPGARLLATGWLQLAAVHQRAGELEEADAANQQALDLLTRRVEKEGQGDLSLHLATACAQSAEARLRGGHGADALALLQRGRLTLERRLSQDASVPVLRQLVDGLSMEAQLLCLASEGDTAVAAAQRAWQMNRKLLAESPHLEDVVRMISTERLLARAFAIAGRMAEGLPHMRGGVQLCNLVTDGAEQPDLLALRADMFADATFFTQRLDRHAESLHYGDRAFDAYNALPASRAMRIKLLVARGECRLALAEWTAALTASDEGLALAADTQDVEADDLDRLYTVRIVGRIALGHAAEALKECRSGARHMRTLAEGHEETYGAAALDLTVLHARVAMQFGALNEAAERFADAVKQDGAQQFCTSRVELCRLLVQGTADDVPQLLESARERLKEGYGRYENAVGNDATDTAPRNLVVDALYLGCEAWHLASRAVDLRAAGGFLRRFTAPRDPEPMIRRAQAGHLRLQAALHLSWIGCVRLWAAETLQAARDAFPLAPADIAPVLVDVVSAIHAVSIDGQLPTGIPSAEEAVRGARALLYRLPAGNPARGPLLDRLAALLFE